MNANAYSDKQTLNIPQTTKARSRKIALAGGIFYLLTFVSIPTAVLYAGVRDPNFIAGAGSDNPVIIGAILEIIVALAGIATAVALYPVVKRQNESLALGFVGARTLEVAAIARAKIRTHLPIVVDVPTIAQRSRYCPAVACAAIGAGADGVILRVWAGRPGERPRVPATLKWSEAVVLAERLRAIADAIRG